MRTLAGGSVVVTGAAGFIGSHLVDRLLAGGRAVRGIDRLDPWYDPATKLANLGAARCHPQFVFDHLDLTTVPHDELVARLSGAEVVFHLAGQPGVQDSWGRGFERTCGQNVLVTQRLFEAAIDAGVGRVVLASSSSVYGDAGLGPDAVEARPVAPISPYGASKVAAEQLAAVYGARDLPVVTLRYFTVFGPRQRPDMAFHRLFDACLGGPDFAKRGDGSQRREFTAVDDVVAATVAAGSAPLERVAGRTFDVGGGCVTSLNEVIDLVTTIAGRRPNIALRPASPGDPVATQADRATTARVLGWHPTTTLVDGLARQWGWHLERLGQRSSSTAASLDLSAAAS